MKEITDIIKAYHQSIKVGLRSALATVVEVEGSSYRRPGARMLITENGMLTGAISGGCLEGDALRKALAAIHQQENRLVTYDTTDEDDAKFGVQLGCNGIVHILFEPIKPGAPNNPIMLLEALSSKRENAVLLTLFTHTNRQQHGTGILYRKDEIHSNINDELESQFKADLMSAYRQQSSSIKHDQYGGSAFIEFIKVPIALVIAGAGNDAQPLATLAHGMGWHTTVIDGRLTHATNERFPDADQVMVLKPENILSCIRPDEQTAFVLMTHNYNYDLHLLKELLANNISYIGTLGPKSKLIRMLDEIGISPSEEINRVYGPVGLDIGAETATEIAVSIVAEIKAVMTGAMPDFLKNKKAPIHAY
jgi:xanthine dehydrogenase accessory factor